MSKPETRQSWASIAWAMARPMPELLPVTTACRNSLDTDIAFRDDLLRPRHVFALEFDEVGDGARCQQQALLRKLFAHVAGQRLVDFAIQALDDVCGKFGRAPKAVPAVELVTRNR